MRLRTRTTAIAAATAIGVTTIGGIALATGAGTGDDDDLRQPGTVAVDESTLPEDDAAEREALAGLASVDEAAAQAAAVEAVGGGEAVGAELDDENGFVVWEVEVRGADGSRHDVTVDAGDASVLGTEIEDADDDSAASANDADDADDDSADSPDDADDD